ncbi:MAG TPA: TIGR03668 family PPOX class F420-dependent oxidoreductase [Kineosporiaceae bacterium]|nr:TIGR03668 family PPOX class F420-dependent oxidoreductase [Kineosporiaceae bacterium]
MTTLDPDAARQLFGAARVARLATVDADARPHLVPIVFVVRGDSLFSAVDAKPKRSQELRRLANIQANPAVSVLVDEYDEDWTALRWARADGVAEVLAPDHPQARAAVVLLAAKYRQYREQPPPGLVLAVEVARWSGWSFVAPKPQSH